MKIGFTGTRNGMTQAQSHAFVSLLMGGEVAYYLGIDALFYDDEKERSRISTFHHGDCKGADDEAADAVKNLRDIARKYRGISIVCHPPADNTHRAFNKHAEVTLEPKTHFARNRDIVNACDLLIATPWQTERPPKGTGGGTWYTIEFAEKQGKPVMIIWPDGNVGGAA
jgi:hypothetical protein